MPEVKSDHQRFLDDLRQFHDGKAAPTERLADIFGDLFQGVTKRETGIDLDENFDKAPPQELPTLRLTLTAKHLQIISAKKTLRFKTPHATVLVTLTE